LRQQEQRPLSSSDPFEPVRVSCSDYFRADCKNKLLHFFIPCSQELKLLRLEDVSHGNWKTVNFKAASALPSYFKSLITPNGDIYLTGGSDGKHSFTQARRSAAKSTATTTRRGACRWLGG
jgi:hypothetical protein